MADKLEYITSDCKQNKSFVDHNKWLKRLDTELYVPTNQKTTKVPKVFESTNKKTLLGTSVINSPISPPSLLCESI